MPAAIGQASANKPNQKGLLQMTETSTDSSFDLITVSFRAYNQQRDLINLAADNAGMTPSDYMREIMTAESARRLGEPMPVLPPIIRGRGSSLIAQAAAKMGMTREQFDRRAAHLYAAQTLGLLTPVPVATTLKRKASQSGEHAVVHESSMRPTARAAGSKR
jgi:uncharacterized protein (DUF1778 family)